MERPQIEVYKTAYSEQMAGKISVPFKILIDVCDYALNLESQLHQEREKRAQAEAENTKLRATIAAMQDALEEVKARCELRRQDDDAHYENYYEAKQALAAAGYRSNQP